MQTITDFQVVDHGIDDAQYFPGCGVAFTDFDYIATGNGDTFAEAIEDALESMAQGIECSGIDFDLLEMNIAMEGFGTVTEGHVTWQESRSAFQECLKANGIDPTDADAVDDLAVYYYVSIRYSVAEVTA
jgi:hypothetical protein